MNNPQTGVPVRTVQQDPLLVRYGLIGATFAIIGLLIAIALPNFLVARKRAQQRSCVANLRQIDGAVNQYALENKLSTGAAAATANISCSIAIRE